MRLNGYSTEWDEDEGLQPIELQDVVLISNPEELEMIAQFLLGILSDCESTEMVMQSLTLRDSKANAQTGIKITVDCSKSRSPV